MSSSEQNESFFGVKVVAVSKATSIEQAGNYPDLVFLFRSSVRVDDQKPTTSRQQHQVTFFSGNFAF